MKKHIIFSSLVMLGGCAFNKPFTDQELAVIKQHTIVVEQPNDNEQLYIFSRNGKVGSEVAGVVLGALTGAFNFHSDGHTPRTRLEHNSAAQLIKVTERKAAAEKLDVITPTKVMTQKLTARFAAKTGDTDALTISVKPIAWHLYYDKFMSDEQTYLLEYASDIKLSLPSAKLKRQFECDESSDAAFTKDEWLENNHQKLEVFVNKTADSCIAKILKELGQK